MTRIGTPLSDSAIRVMLLGSGELGKEVAIELQRLGAEVVAVDRYPNAPAMQVAHRSHVIPMTDPQVLNGVIMAEAPHIIVPEIEAIATDVLARIEERPHCAKSFFRNTVSTSRRRSLFAFLRKPWPSSA